MATLKEMVSDSTRYPDSLEIVAGDSKMTLGEIRVFGTDGAKQIAEDRARLEQTRRETSEFYAKTQAAAQELEAYRQQLIAAQNAQPAAQPGEYNLDSDAYLNPVVTMVRNLEAKIASYENDIATLRGNEQQMAAVFLDRDWDSQMSGIKDMPNDINREKVLRYAVENGIVDKYKLPNLRVAYERMTEPMRLEKMTKEAEARGAEKARMESGGKNLSRISAGLPSLEQPSGATPFKSIREAFAAANKDPEIVSTL